MESIEHLLERVRERVPRLTKGKKAVVEILFAAEHSMTAQEIYSSWEERKHDQSELPHLQDIDLVTIYRNLEQLEKLGIVCKMEHSHGSWRYCLTGTHTERHHSHTISCVSCGKQLAIGACVLSEVDKIIAERTGFQNIHHVVQFTGACPECTV